MDNPDHRLLVVAPNWLGDVVMHTSLLSFLQVNRDHAAAAVGRPITFHLGVREAWAGLFREDPRVNELKVLEPRDRHRGARGTFRLSSWMRQGDYDSVILGPPSMRAAAAAWLSRIPCRVGYRADGRSPFLTRGLSPRTRGSLHYAREMVELGRAWLNSVGADPVVSPDDEFLPSLPGCDNLPPTEMRADRPIWAVAPGTTFGQAKTWPADRLGDFLRLAIENEGVRVVLLGDEKARGFTIELKNRFRDFWCEDPRGDGLILDLTGQTDLIAAAGILKSSEIFVGNDSGLMHLAAALGRPTVGVFGSSNPDWTAPLGPRTRVIIPTGFDCRPCYRKTCNQAQFCLDTVSGNEVLATALDLVGDARALREES